MVGTDWISSSGLPMLRFSSSLALNALIAIGTSWTFSARRWAVTVISSSAPPSSSGGCWAWPTGTVSAAAANNSERVSAVFIEHLITKCE